MLEELTALNELHDEVDAVRFLEHVVHANDERMVDLVEDQLLDLERLDGLVLDHHVLPNAFHGVMAVVLLIVHEVHFAERAPSNNADQFEVVPSHLGHGGPTVQARRASVPAIAGFVLGHLRVERSLLLGVAGAERARELLFVHTDGQPLGIVTMPAKLVQVGHQTLRFGKLFPLHHGGACLEDRSSIGGRLVKFDVLFVDA